MKKAFKQHYSFASDAHRYEIFLKQHLFELKPNYYGLTHKQKIKTADGWMYAVHLCTIIEDPNLESVAECWINGQLIYLWRDRCWGVAVDEENKAIRRFDPVNLGNGLNPCWEILADNCSTHGGYQNKSLVIYPIGDPIDASDTTETA